MRVPQTACKPTFVPATSLRLITRTTELVELCRRWRGQTAIGLDTEFVRERTYHPLPALVQVADPDACWLLDPLALDRLEPLFELLEDESTTKVMHAPAQDLELFRLMGAQRPRAIYDTQTAAILAGLGQGPGYQSLVADLLGEDLHKTETRSDWRRRPLSEAQQHYAAQDVAYLLSLKVELERRLTALGRLDWLREEGERLVTQAWTSDDGAGLRKLRQAWRLPPVSQELLKRLWMWREARARELDRPRQRVLRDGPLQQIARELPTTNADLARMNLPPGWIRRFAEEVLDRVQTVRSLPDDELEVSFPPPANRGESADRLRRLRKKVSELAEKLDLPASFLVNRQTLEGLALAPPEDGRLPEELRGWREAVVGEALLATLREAPEAGEQR